MVLGICSFYLFGDIVLGDSIRFFIDMTHIDIAAPSLLLLL